MIGIFNVSTNVNACDDHRRGLYGASMRVCTDNVSSSPGRVAGSTTWMALKSLVGKQVCLEPS